MFLLMFPKMFPPMSSCPHLGSAYKVRTVAPPSITHPKTAAKMVAASSYYAFLAAVAVAFFAVARAGTVRISPESELGERHRQYKSLKLEQTRVVHLIGDYLLLTSKFCHSINFL